jgi:hypothetical protein
MGNSIKAVGIILGSIGMATFGHVVPAWAQDAGVAPAATVCTPPTRHHVPGTPNPYQNDLMTYVSCMQAAGRSNELPANLAGLVGPHPCTPPTTTSTNAVMIATARTYASCMQDAKRTRQADDLVANAAQDLAREQSELVDGFEQSINEKIAIIYHDFTPEALAQATTDPIIDDKHVIDELTELLDAYSHHDVDRAEAARVRVNAAKATANANYFAEGDCRKSKDCMKPRIARLATELCTTVTSSLEDKQFRLHQIALERSNPSGFVDGNKLHSDGEEVQGDDARIAEARARYAAMAHAPLVCK